MVLMLSVHPSRQPDLLTEHVIQFSPGVTLAITTMPSAISALDWWRHLA